MRRLWSTLTAVPLWTLGVLVALLVTCGFLLRAYHRAGQRRDIETKRRKIQSSYLDTLTRAEGKRTEKVLAIEREKLSIDAEYQARKDQIDIAAQTDRAALKAKWAEVFARRRGEK